MAGRSAHDFVVSVRTGDIQGAGTDANVCISLLDDQGRKTQDIYLDNFFRNDFERGNLDVFEISRNKTDGLGKLHSMDVQRDNSGFGSSWYVERINLENKSTGDVYIFPVFRWLRANFRYVFRENDTFLPQDDDQKEQRRLGLEDKRKQYQIDLTDLQLPARVKKLPVDELFSSDFKWDLKKLKYNLIIQSRITMITTGTWKSLDDVRNIYVRDIFTEPMASKLWEEDWFFAYQRLNGAAPTIIQLCTEIPQKLAVTDEDLKPFLEGRSITQTLADTRLFCCDLQILEKLPQTMDKGNGMICAPILLLYKNNKDQLLPIAIQLLQNACTDNPVFFPSDDKYTWLLVKMWYNHSEAGYHQSLTHLGFTHLLMEGIVLTLHRTVSVSHPIFKLLAPHQLYLMAINSRGVETLFSEGGWMDKTMTIGKDGVLELIRKGFKLWQMNIDGSLPEDLKHRGVYDKAVLPYYYYRDDALLVYEAIKNYVTSYVNLYYDSPQRLINDNEIQDFAETLIRDRCDEGMGIKGVPGNGRFQTLDELIQTLTSFIFTSSVQHAAVNFPQYEYYGFPPAFALTLRGTAPKDKKPRTVSDIISALPDKTRTFDAMIVTKILSTQGLKPLGDFEVEYIYDPPAKKIVKQFRDDLRTIGAMITKRNSSMDMPYNYLHPDSIPNSISI